MKEPRHNYTGRGWEGDRYDPELNITTIAALVRNRAKSLHRDCTFSIRVQRYAGGRSLYIYLMAAPFEAFSQDSPGARESGHAQLNENRMDPDDPYNNGVRLTSGCYEVMQDMVEYAKSFNFSDTDSQIDYFHTNFYLHVNVGKWNKPFKKKGE